MTVRNMKKCYVASVLAFVALFSAMVVSADTQSVTKNFTLTNFDVTFTFPKNGNPGDSIVVSATAVAKSYVRIADLSIQVLAYTESGDLQSIGSASLATNQYVSNGDKFSKDLSVTIPTNTPRGELTAVFSQATSLMNYGYPYYSSYYYYRGYPTYYWYYPYYYSYYSDTSYQNYIESKMLPCSYVLATTPEYVKLKSDYDSLSSQYNDISTRYQQAMQQNKDLTDKLSQTTQDANNSKILAYSFIASTLVLAALTASLLLGHLHRRTVVQPSESSTSSTSRTTKSKEATPTTEKK